MLVMKFGGASVRNADAVRNVCRIIRNYVPEKKLLVVISAMDKTTNHLEKLAGAARDCDEPGTWERFRKIRDFHHGIIDELFDDAEKEVREQVSEYMAQIERICRGILLLSEFPPRTYDRIVAFGELLSTCIVSHYLRKEGLAVTCPDARTIIKTDASYSHARVIWSLTRENIDLSVRPLFENNNVIVTQGFIASSIEGKVTTLGREGSDYSASIFANGLGAESLTVWKDVRGILNGDPRIEKDTVKLDELSYERAVEMTFYGASVIHPKTIKPLRNANIPFYVKCFTDESEPGTTIGAENEVTLDNHICSRIVKKNQTLLQIKPRDFSFMAGNQLNRIFNAASRTGLEVNLVQTTAISLTLCVNNVHSPVQEFESILMDNFEIAQEGGLVLKTFINYGEAELEAVKAARVIQQTEDKLLAVLPA